MARITEVFRLLRKLYGPLPETSGRRADAIGIPGLAELLGDDVTLPHRYLGEIWPELAERTVAVGLGISHAYELPYGERLILAGIVEALRPRRIFEIGTFTGVTTRVLARAAGAGATVHTIDLPEEEIRDPDCRGRIGREFLAGGEAGAEIILHRGNTRYFDFTPFQGRMDLVFIDGSHAYGDVLADTAIARALLSPGGLIVWDDYHPVVPGVVRALNHLRRTLDLVRITHSRLVVHAPGRILSR